MRSPKFKIGNIVALLIHPYNKDFTSIHLGGEPQFISPLMTIIEIILTYTEAIKGDPESAFVSKIHYKCLWYCSKTHEFEETWLFEEDLKLITSKRKNLKKGDFKNLKKSSDFFLVALKTQDLELNKIKTTYSLNENTTDSNTNISTTSNSLLTFLSPTLQVIELLSKEVYNTKENFFYKHTKFKRRIISEYFVKCKWYNPGSNKFSEKVFSIDALKLFFNVKLSMLKKIEDSIISEKVIYLKSIKAARKKIIIPRSIVNINGYFVLRGYDVIENRVTEHDILDIKIDVMDDFVMEVAPTFNYITAGTIKESISKEYIDLVKKAKSNRNYIRIKYKNINDKISLRTLKNMKITTVNSRDDGKIYYLKAYCYTRKGERIFKLSNVQRIEIIDLKY